MYLPISITFVVAAAIINLWLSWRVATLRLSKKVLHGDGGMALVAKRIRAHANFSEYTPYVLILFALIEMAIGSQSWLWILAIAYLVGRILHPIGMDYDTPHKARMVGILLTYVVTLALCITGIYAVYVIAPQYKGAISAERTLPSTSSPTTSSTMDK